MNAQAAFCRCLCAVNHPDYRGVCTGAPDAEIYFRHPSEDDELLAVAMCMPCATHTLAAAKRLDP